MNFSITGKHIGTPSPKVQLPSKPQSKIKTLSLHTSTNKSKGLPKAAVSSKPHPSSIAPPSKLTESSQTKKGQVHQQSDTTAPKADYLDEKKKEETEKIMGK